MQFGTRSILLDFVCKFLNFPFLLHFIQLSFKMAFHSLRLLDNDRASFDFSVKLTLSDSYTVLFSLLGELNLLYRKP